MTLLLLLEKFEAKRQQLLDYREDLYRRDGAFKEHARIVAEGRIAQIDMDIAEVRAMATTNGELAKEERDGTV